MVIVKDGYYFKHVLAIIKEPLSDSYNRYYYIDEWGYITSGDSGNDREVNQ